MYINKRRLSFLTIAMIAAGGFFMCNELKVNASGLSGCLPTAGFSLTVEGGSSIKDVKDEVQKIVESKANLSATKSTEKKSILGEVTPTPTAEIEEENLTTVENTIDFDKEIVEPVTYVEPAEEVVEEEAKEDFSNLVIAKVHDYVNVRDYPDEEEGKIVGKLYDKSVGNFIEETNGWYLIESGNCKGYVKGEYCVTGDDAVELAKEVGTLMARVNTTTLKVREEASLEATVLGLVPIDDELLVTEELDGWVKVDIEEGYGFVSLDYVDLHTEFVKAESKEEEEARLKKEKAERDKANAAARKAAAANNTNAEGSSSSSSSQTSYVATGSGTGASVANFALQFVGNPYVYGGSSLTHGTDCSGFVMSVYNNFGVSLPHSSSADRSVGYDVGGLANAQAGDIVCYSGHVGIYIGGGQIVHASTSRTGIIVSNVNYRNPICVRRIF